MEQYRANSLTLIGAVAMGTGVMIGAGIFTLTGQVAELAGDLFPIAFLVAAIVVAFSAYSYIKMSNAPIHRPAALSCIGKRRTDLGKMVSHLIDANDRPCAC